MDSLLNIYLTILVWIAMGAATAYFARKRGRDPIIWFVVGLLFGIFGFIGLFIMPSFAAKSESVEEEKPLVLILPFGYRRKEWFYLTSAGEQVGPLSFELLQQNWAEGKILEQTYVWCDEMKEWSTLNEILAQTPDFFS